MAFNIDTFTSNIESYGVLQNNKYEFNIAPPTNLTNVAGVGRLLNFRAESVRIPAAALNTKDVYRYGVGTSQKQPFSAQQSDITVSFLCDKYSLVWDFWYSWIRNIFEFNGVDGNNNITANYSTEYKSNYTTNAQIVIYDSVGEIAKIVDLYEVFPIALNEVQLAWGDQNQPIRLATTLAYKEFTFQNVP